MKRLVGGIMLAVGLLITTGSGLCSLALMSIRPQADGAPHNAPPPSILETLTLAQVAEVLSATGPFLVAGLVLTGLGVRLLRQARRDDADRN